MTDRPNYVHEALELFAGFGDREALVGGGRRLTYPQVAARVRGLAAALRRHGVRPGAAVLVMLGNTVEGPLLQLALHLLGCRSMWIAPVTSRREVDEFVALSAPEAFVHDPRDPQAVRDRGRPVRRTGALPRPRRRRTGPDRRRPVSRPRSCPPRRPRRSRSCRPAAPPARRSWCTTGRASTGRSSPWPPTSGAPGSRCCGTCRTRRCGWPAARSPRCSTCSPAACCSCASSGTRPRSSPPWTPSGSPPRSSPRRCSTRCSTTPTCRAPTSPPCSCSTWAPGPPRPPGCARPSPASARACASCTGSARRWSSARCPG